MKKRAEEIFNLEIKNTITAPTINHAEQSIEKLIALAGILDAMGATADADRVDAFLKEAGGLMDFFSGFLGGGATTKNEEGDYFAKTFLDAARGGDWSKVLSKETLVPVLTHAITAGAISSITGEIIEVLAQKVPGFTLIKDAPFTKAAISGALTYAITKSDFVSKLIDGLTDEVGKVFGMQPKHQNVPMTAKPVAPTPTPASTQPVAIEQPKQPAGEGSSTQSFQVAAPGAKI